MFKRVEKRLKKREEEMKLGIDEETRDILGLNDTDSDESESEPSEGENETSSFENESEEEWGGIGGHYGEEESEEEEEEDGDEEDEEEEEGPVRHVAFQTFFFTTQQALDEPIYAHPTRTNAQLCAICPGKTLLHPLAISEHLASKAHERRSRHIANLASLPQHVDSSLSDLMQLMEGERRPGIPPSDGHTIGEGTSKRAEKKRKAGELRKSMREKKKAREQEKKEKQKAEDAQGDQRPAKAPSAKSKDRVKAESANTAQAKQPEPLTTKRAANKATIAKPGNDKKRKKGGEKQKYSVVTTDSHAPFKKRKPDDEDILKEEVAQQIKNIAKSATMRAHLAQSKAEQNGGEGKPKPKKGNKST